MNPLVGLGERRAHAEKQRAFRRPIPRGACAVFPSRDHQQGHTLALIPHRRIVDGHGVAARKMQGDAALGPGNQQIFEADVRKGPPHHDAVVAAARTVRVEVLFLDSPLHEVAAGRAVLRDVPCGRDVVRGHRIAEQRQHAGAADFGDHLCPTLELGEKRRLLDVGRILAPLVELASGHGNGIPGRVAVPDVFVNFSKHLRTDSAVHGLENFLLRGPEVAEIDRRALGVPP